MHKIEINTKIGIIGVGLMGHGIASNLAKSGCSLTLLNHAGNQDISDLLQLGATKVDSIKEIAATADIIILCVTGTPQVENILYSNDGLLEHLRANTLIIDCSTSIPSSTEKIAADIKNAGGLFIDAPMTRTPKEAAEGRLNLIVGGDKDVFDNVKPLLEIFAENIVHAGDVGSGHRMKLIHNFVSLGFSTILAEAAACAEKADINPNVLLDILSSGGGKGVVLDRLTPYIASQDDSGFRFSISNAHKDLSYYTRMADESKSYHETADAIQKTLSLGMTEDKHATMPQLISILRSQTAIAK